MSAYVITDVEITDAELFGQFFQRVTGTVEAHGGRFVARGGEIEVRLGSWTPTRLSILEFGSLEQARAWLDSPEYTELGDLLSRAANVNMVVTEGL
ncbi:MAG: DUF1330 domain-containing protein [Chloroflexota bacterium]|nr:DUF1330 domain-containing protein [Chloroflexota bacterium]MDE2885629.1 DUF1330 domain-containing protein [Chloroflexota bacterium]